MIVSQPLRLVFEPSGLSISCTGFGEASLEGVATRWCCGVGTVEEAMPGVELRVRSGGKEPTGLDLQGDSQISESTFDERRFGNWRALIRPGRGLDEIRAFNAAATLSADFQRAVDLGVTHLLALQGGAVLHGAAFEIGRDSVLSIGHSGSGKSTVAAAALTAGGRIVSDDLLLAATLPSGEAGLATMRRFMVFRKAGFEGLPEKLRKVSRPLDVLGESRWKLSPSAEPSAFTEWTVPERIWLVSVDRRLRSSRLMAVDQATALAWLMRGTTQMYLSTPFDRERDAQLEALTTLAEACPAYRVRLGNDLLARPLATLEKLLCASAG